ncbi:MAG: NADH-quinone oxidoreductase subunit J [Planctomycetes bacterium]|nr:NADH-quinone oxidoreductase subunit J [Planctomycetota bacterium]
MVEPFGAVKPLLFYALAAVIVLSAWGIVLSQNIVRMAVYLLLTLAGVAGFYFMLHAEFLAAVQLIVYAGGTLILIVFGVMLTSKNPFMQLKTALWERFVGVLIGLVIFGLLLFGLVHTALPTGAAATGESGGGHYQVAAIGRALLSDYLVPFEVAAVLLLVVMIGAAFMARRSAKQGNG